MEEAELRDRIARNLVNYRKLNGYTQADIAQRINYSDKSVSKWERGEGVPDVFVLMQLANLYEIAIGELIGESGEAETPPLTGQARTRRYILLMAVGLVWLAAALAYFLFAVLAPGGGDWWLAFVYALPVTAVVLTVLANVWQYTYRYRLIVSSGIIWGVALSLHLTFRYTIHIALIYLVAAIFQGVWILWHKFIRHYFKKR